MRCFPPSSFSPLFLLPLRGFVSDPRICFRPCIYFYLRVCFFLFSLLYPSTFLLLLWPGRGYAYATRFTSAPSVPALLGTGLFISGFLSDLRFRFPMKLSRYMAVFHARFHFIFSVLFAAFYAACFPAHICCR